MGLECNGDLCHIENCEYKEIEILMNIIMMKRGKMNDQKPINGTTIFIHDKHFFWCCSLATKLENIVKPQVMNTYEI